MSKSATEQLSDAIGDMNEIYVHEYVKSITKSRISKRKVRFTLPLAAALAALLGTVSLAAVPVIGRLRESRANESRVVVSTFDEIEAAYAVPINDTQECEGVTGTFNSAVLEDHYLLLSCTFDWSGLEEARDGSFHTYFLPWFFHVTEGGNTVCGSEYTEGLHTQTYFRETDDDFSTTILYCIDLGETLGRDLIGKELTVSLLYSHDGEGFVSSFTPKDCFTDEIRDINRTYSFGEHEITLKGIQESALYVTLFIDCDTIGGPDDEYGFMLSDSAGNDYSVYPYEANDVNGYWFIKPDTADTELTLKIIRSSLRSDSYGQITDDSYEILWEIPIEAAD